MTSNYVSEEGADAVTNTPKGHRLTFKRACPSCQRTYALERVPRSFFLKYILFFIPTRVYRCYNCQQKFTRIN
ncbi:hypothetical protein [Spirosoma radiotolerans]|uniref:hypothetical protein n=1 Tax=Spirosoma radiotolerans TaxID=1379870 RepID=UPI000A409522|nr:hypothetical protein [Spirosoma radiotolerans]